MGVIDELKSQARSTEKELEKHLETLEKIHSLLNPEDFEVVSDKNPELILQQTIEHLLSQLKHTSEQMQKISATHVERSLSQSYIQAHKSGEKRYITVKNAIQNKRWEQELLGKEFVSGYNGKIDLLIREEKNIDESLEMGKNILAAAQEVRVSMAYQGKKLNGTSDKIVSFAETLPGINLLMKRIGSRKRFNAIVLGLAVGVCVCIVVYKVF